MKKNGTMFNIKRKKSVAVGFTLLISLIGSATVYATSNGTNLLGKTANNEKMSYSIDNGKTWSDEKPEGCSFEEDEEGNKSISIGNSEKKAKPENLSEMKNSSSVMVKQDNNVTYYSINDGKTWSTSIPSGYEKKFNVK